MTIRERWIVYPLLFYAVISSMKAEIVVPLDAEHENIRCQRLTVESINGQPLVELSGQLDADGDEAGLLVIFGRQEQAAQARLAATATPRPRRVELGSDGSGGYLKSFGQAGAPTLNVGHDGQRQRSGFVAEDDNGVWIRDPGDATDATWGQTIDWEQPVAAEAEAADAAEPTAAGPELTDPARRRQAVPQLQIAEWMRAAGNSPAGVHRRTTQP